MGEKHNMKAMNTGTIEIDSSEAFAKMPHALLVAELHAYNVFTAACNFLIIIWKK